MDQHNALKKIEVAGYTFHAGGGASPSPAKPNGISAISLLKPLQRDLIGYASEYYSPSQTRVGRPVPVMFHTSFFQERVSQRKSSL